MNSLSFIASRSIRPTLLRIAPQVFFPRALPMIQIQSHRTFTENKKEKSRWNWFSGGERKAEDKVEDVKKPEEESIQNAFNKEESTQETENKTQESAEKPEEKSEDETEKQSENKSEEKSEEASDKKSEKKEEPKEEPKVEKKPEVSNSEKIEMYDILNKKLTDLRAARVDDSNKIKAAWVEVENIRKSSQKDIESAKQFGLTGFSKDLLDVADNLTRALNSVPQQKLDDNTEVKALYEGVLMIKNQLHKAFKKHGLEEFEPVLGDKFDYNREDGLFKMRDPTKQTGSVGALLKTGYTLNGRVIRAAQVGVVDNGDQE